jgi:exodeoxyribonuclease VII large subunit
MVSPDRQELIQEIRNLQRRLTGRVESLLRERSSGLHALTIRTRAASPHSRLQNIRQQVDDLSRRAEAAVQAGLTLNRTRLHGLARILDGVGPANVLARGYALVWRERDGRLVRCLSMAPAGVPLRIQLAEGNLKVVSGGSMEINSGSRRKPPE